MGLELDFEKKEAGLPHEKLVKLRYFLQLYKHRRKVKLRDFQSLTGMLNFYCNVVLSCRAFMRRLIYPTKGIHKPQHRVTLSKEDRRDLKAWSVFCVRFLNTHTLYGSWPQHLTDFHITVKELFPIAQLTIELWKQNCTIHILCYTLIIRLWFILLTSTSLNIETSRAW